MRPIVTPGDDRFWAHWGEVEAIDTGNEKGVLSNDKYSQICNGSVMLRKLRGVRQNSSGTLILHFFVVVVYSMLHTYPQ